MLVIRRTTICNERNIIIIEDASIRHPYLKENLKINTVVQLENLDAFLLMVIKLFQQEEE